MKARLCMLSAAVAVCVTYAAALELGNTTTAENGGVESGIDVYGEHLILNGTGDAAFGDAPLTVLSGSNAAGPGRRGDPRAAPPGLSVVGSG